jgi:hypothetical protein
MHDGRPLIAVSSGFLEFSQVTQPSTTGLPQRFVQIIMHSYEWECFAAFVCMVFGVTSLHAHLFRDVLQISSRSQGSYNGGSCNGKPGLPLSLLHGTRADFTSDKSQTPFKMFTMKKSASTVGTGNCVNADTFALPNDVTSTYLSFLSEACTVF